MARQLSKPAPTVKVYLARLATDRGTAITGPSNYDSFEVCPWLAPVLVEERLAPAWHRAKFTLDPTKVDPPGVHRAWKWRTLIQPDGLVKIVDWDTQKVYFFGFIADVDASWSSDSETVAVTAVSLSYRLARDLVVYGRHMYSSGGGTPVVQCTGLPTIFNPGGVPNMHWQKRTDIPGAPPAGVRVFTHDGDPLAEFWTVGDAVEHLAWHYNSGQVWTFNPLAHDTSKMDDARVSVSVQGLSLLAALAAAAEKAAWDLAESFYNTSPQSVLSLKERGAGTVKVLKMQDLEADGSRPPLDLRETNLFAPSVAESTTAAVTRPTVAGGRDLYQITIPLQPAWDPARMDLLEGEDPTGPADDSQYARRYTTRGGLHPDYADVGRLWDANTDGRFTVEPYGLTTPDAAAVAGETAGTWPAMPFAPHPLLTAVSPPIKNGDEDVSARPPSQEMIVEVSFDAGSSWLVLDGCRVAPDRLAIVLTVENLGDVDWMEPTGGQPDFFSALWADHESESPAQVLLRLTCTIEGPHRRIERPALTAVAATNFETTEWFDEGELDQSREIASSSVWGDGGAYGDTADGLTDLTARAERIRDASEGRSIEAHLAMEWLEDSPELTDVIEKIEGIEYDLGTTRGSTPVYPRVVGRVLHFDNWSVSLLLGTERKAGTVFHAAGRAMDRYGNPLGWKTE